MTIFAAMETNESIKADEKLCQTSNRRRCITYLSISLCKRSLRSGRRLVHKSSVTISIFSIIMLTISAITWNKYN